MFVLTATDILKTMEIITVGISFKTSEILLT